MDAYGEAIHATRQSPFPYDFEWGWITQRLGDGSRPDRLYLLLKEWPQVTFTLRGLRTRVRLARELAAPDKNLPFEQHRHPDHDLDELSCTCRPKNRPRRSRWLPSIWLGLSTLILARSSSRG